MYTGINHLAMATRDMDSTIRFWRDILGMRLILGLGKPGYRHYFFEISPHDTIAFFEWSDVEPIEEKDHGYPVKGPFAFDHISIGVSERETLWRLKALLDTADYWTSEIIDHGFILSLYSYDPNGIAIEFSYVVEEFNPHRLPKMLDLHPSALALEGPEPQADRVPALVLPSEGDRVVYPGERDQFESRHDHWEGRHHDGSHQETRRDLQAHGDHDGDSRG